jgi:hypothetical protein
MKRYLIVIVTDTGNKIKIDNPILQENFLHAFSYYDQNNPNVRMNLDNEMVFFKHIEEYWFERDGQKIEPPNMTQMEGFHEGEIKPPTTSYIRGHKWYQRQRKVME